MVGGIGVVRESRRSRRCVIWLIAAILTAAPACRTPEKETVQPAPLAAGANLLLITVDTLRADRLPAYGGATVATPAMSRLAAEGIRFSAAFTPVPLTLPAHASALTGLLPTRHGVRDNGGFYLGPNHPTLAESLKRSGYRTGAFVSAFVLDRRWGLARGFDEYFSGFTVTAQDLRAMARVQRPAGETWAAARRWLDQRGDQTLFAWLHFFDPHTPYDPPPPFDAQYAGRPYDGEIAYVDTVIADILAYLESQGLLEKTIVVLAADHGEGLGEHDEDEHGLLAYDSTLHVPWIIRFPHRAHAGRVIDAPVSLVDLFPTVAGLLGQPVPPGIDGVDRTPYITTRPDPAGALYGETYYPRLRMGWSELLTIRSGEHKYIRAPVPELYNYKSDPGERTNLVDQYPEIARRLDRILTALLTESGGSNRPSAVDPQTARQLQSLGYVSGAAAPLDTSKGLADPKSRTAVYRAITRARQQLAEGSSAEGVRTLQAVILDDPGFEAARRTLREYWIGTRRFPEAVGWLRSALARHAAVAGLWRDLAIVARAAGDRKTAREGIDRALAIRGNDADTLLVAGEIERDERRLDRALAYFSQAVEHAADPVVPRMQSAQTLLAMGRVADAEAAVRSALAADSNAASAHYLLAQVAEARRDFRTAETEYRLEIERNPWEYRARFNLALLLGARRAQAEQLAMLQSIPPVAPEFGEVYFYIAKALLDLGDPARLPEAVKAAERGLQLAPTMPTAPLGHYVLADVYNLTGRQADAARELARARSLEQRIMAGAK